MDSKPVMQKFDSAFEQEIYEGLSAFPKYIASKWFYDERGDKLFQEIMNLPEYYLTGCEFEILKTYAQKICALFSSAQGFDLVELGAGDGKKTKILLEHLLASERDFIYKPIDISEHVLDTLSQDLKRTYPNLRVVTQQGRYFKVLEKLSSRKTQRKTVIMVLGSNIGNLYHDQAIQFLTDIRNCMHTGDLLFMGFDQKKDPQTIAQAYNDSQGITRAFNKNVLRRINKSLNANFDLETFKHWPVYDPETGTAKSYLVSTCAQRVQIEGLNLEVNFKAWESIHTEISQKYDDGIINWLAEQAGLEVLTQFEDSQGYFADYVFKSP